jgi:uncharacterized protein (DUF433 family)
MEFASTQHIEARPEVNGGKPCIAGTRIRVWDIHVWHNLQGQSPEEIVAEFSQLSVADVHAALAFYHDNRDALETQNRQAEERVQRLIPQFPSKLRSSPGKDAGDAPISS